MGKILLLTALQGFILSLYRTEHGELIDLDGTLSPPMQVKSHNTKATTFVLLINSPDDEIFYNDLFIEIHGIQVIGSQSL